MGKEVRYVMEHDRIITEAEIAMIEAARELPETFDADNPPIDPTATPEINNHPPSGWFCLCGHSPLFLANTSNV